MLCTLLLSLAAVGAGVTPSAAAVPPATGKAPLLKELNFDKSQLKVAIKHSREKDTKAVINGLGAAEVAARADKRDNFIRGAASSSGKTYNRTEVDLLELGREIVFYAPRDVEINRVNLKFYEDGLLEAEVDDSPYSPANEREIVADATASAAAPEKVRTASGNYRLEVQDRGYMNATWERWVVKNDGDPTYNFYATKRRAYTDTLDSWTSGIQSMYMSSYPGAGYQDVFLWNDENVPGSDYENCGPGYQLGLGAGPIWVFNVSIPGDCVSVDVAAPDPGRYSLMWDPSGFTLNSGSAEYGQSVVVPQGAEVRWGYTQQVTVYGGRNWTCKSSGQPSNGQGGNKICPWQ
ncbi:hypothetical protein [Nonomuraea endophytica]|uniref:hypothetical protein n=1 Tax=Nonomuraea endophytica TaxID=714136 RepID=UPI0037C97E6E